MRPATAGPDTPMPVLCRGERPETETPAARRKAPFSIGGFGTVLLLAAALEFWFAATASPAREPVLLSTGSLLISYILVFGRIIVSLLVAWAFGKFGVMHWAL